jgi:hypothetical protein
MPFRHVHGPRQGPNARPAVGAGPAPTAGLRCLTLYPEYAHLVVNGTKVEEYRSWAPRITLPGLILVHSGRPEGRIIGAVTITHLVGTPGNYAWQLARPRPFRRPIACPGKLGLWVPDDAVLRAALAELGPTRPAA